MQDRQEIYMDRVAASPIRREALEVMIPLLEEGFGNPQSVHSRGQRAAEALERGRERVAALVGASPGDVIFTASGSEANNLALKGIARGRKGKSSRIVISAVEHLSISAPAADLEKEGFEKVVLPVDPDGLVDPGSLREALKGGAAVVSMICASTEIGTVQPVAELASVCAEAGVPFHTDAWGAAGMIPLDIAGAGISAMSIAAQNFGGPPGAAALILGGRFPLRPIIRGGVQERNLRAGQENVPAIAGMGAAAEAASAGMSEAASRMMAVRDALLAEVPASIPDVIVTGHREKRLPGHASFCVKFIEGEGLLLFLDNQGIMAASGSACTSRSLKGSSVLEAIGLDAATAQGSVVFTLGEENTTGEAKTVVEAMKPVVSRLREMSPIYRARKD